MCPTLFSLFGQGLEPLHPEVITYLVLPSNGVVKLTVIAVRDLRERAVERE
jgi:hypothetical protein